jgi:hypothetical protein
MMPRDKGEGAAATGEEPGRPAVPEWTIFGSSRGARKPVPEEARHRSPLFIIVAALLVVGFCIGAILIAGQVMGSKPVPGTNISAIRQPAFPESVIPPVTVHNAETPSSSQGFSSATGTLPLNGIWVRISYPRDFSGTLEAQGWTTVVNGSGTRLYQLPVHDTLIVGAVDKLDGSGNTLEVGVYNGGTLIAESRTAKPWGSIDLNTRVGPALMNGPVIPLAPPVIIVPPTPDTSLTLHPVPASGIWVRVAYPGNFTGTITANGLASDVNSSGDQIYRIPMTGGTIDGFIAKGDGSVKNLMVQVYRDGSMVTYGNTSTPLGTVEIHTKV